MVKQLTPEVLNEISELQGLKRNPEQKRVLFTARVADTEKNSYRYQLWLLEGSSKRLLLEHTSPFAYGWATNQIVLLAIHLTDEDREKAKQQVSSLYKFNVDTKEVTPAFRVPFPVEGINYFNETTILLETFLPAPSQISSAQGISESAPSGSNQAFHVFSELRFYQNDRGFLDQRQRGLFAVNQETGHFFRVTPDKFDLADYVKDPTTDWLWLSGQYPKNGIRNNNDHLLKINLKTRKAQLVFSDETIDIQKIVLLHSEPYVLATNHPL